MGSSVAMAVECRIAATHFRGVGDIRRSNASVLSGAVQQGQFAPRQRWMTAQLALRRSAPSLSCCCSTDEASASVSAVAEPALEHARGGRVGHSQRVLKELQGAGTLEDAKEAIEREMGNFSPANCSTALKVIGQLARGLSRRESHALGNDPLVLRLQEEVVLQLDHMHPPQLADIVWAFGRLGHHPGPFLDLITKKSVEQITDFRVTDISKVMWAHAKLDHLPRVLFDAISDALLANGEWKATFSSGTPIALSNMVWACGKLQYSNVSLLDCLCTACLGKLGEFTPQSISNTVWGFAVLKINSSELLDAAAAAAEAQMESFTTANLVNLIWSFGVLGYAPSSVIATLIPQAALRLRRGNPQDVSNLAVTCARLGVAPPVVMDAVAGRAAETLSAFKPQEYAGLLWAFATLAYPLPSPLFSEIRAKLADKIRHCSGREVCTMLWAFSRMDTRLSPEELSCLVVRAGELIPLMDDTNAAGIVGALARLSPDIHPSQTLAALVDKAWSRFSGQSLEAVPDADLPGLLWAFCRLDRKLKHFDPADKGKWPGQGKRRQLPGGLVSRLLARMGNLSRESFVLLLFTLGSYRQQLPTAALTGVAGIVSEHMGRMTSRELSQSLWAMAKLGHMDADTMDLATTVLPIKLKYAVPQDVSMIMCAFAELDYKNFALCEGYTSWAAAQPQAFSATDLCNLIWACAELTFHPGLQQLDALLAEVERRPGDFSVENRSTLKWAKRRLKSVYASKPQLDPEYQRRRRSYSREYVSKSARARQRRISTIAEWYADESVYDYFEEEWGDVWL